jgi:hypothetical protein
MNQELLASLRILAHVARADSRIRSEERLALDALGERDGGISASQVLHDETDLEELLRAVISPELRHRTLVEAIALANVDGHCAPEERVVLERIRDAFGASAAIDLVAGSAAWKRRSRRIREALEAATAAYLHQVHDQAAKTSLSMESYGKLVVDFARAKEEIQHAFRDAVDAAEADG